ncbi:DsbA family protein [Pseudogracilibacillus sp. SO30301A]|uniref:DsbA family protein n=1 Tax=Pseudogracilibacillus sp. SO30301A TaxID=3098291 RepID=UPI00300E521B
MEFKSYELDPDAFPYSNEEKTKKYGIPNEKKQEMINQMRSHAEEIGLTINFENLEETSTFNAHRLVKYAEKQGKESDVIESII